MPQSPKKSSHSKSSKRTTPKKSPSSKKSSNSKKCSNSKKSSNSKKCSNSKKSSKKSTSPKKSPSSMKRAKGKKNSQQTPILRTKSYENAMASPLDKAPVPAELPAHDNQTRPPRSVPNSQNPRDQLKELPKRALEFLDTYIPVNSSGKPSEVPRSFHERTSGRMK